MRTKTHKAKNAKYNWKSDWALHSPEDWVVLLIAVMGFAQLMPNVSFGMAFDVAWPTILAVIFFYKFGKRNYIAKRG